MVYLILQILAPLLAMFLLGSIFGLALRGQLDAGHKARLRTRLARSERQVMALHSQLVDSENARSLLEAPTENSGDN